MSTTRSNIHVRLDQFEGPLDLLLYLIQSHEMDISTVSISKVTDQYLMTIKMMHELNFDLASEFLLIAATLVYWKSKAILPKELDPNAGIEEEGEILTQEDLLRQLLEHQRFLAAGDELALQPKLFEDVFTRPNKKPPIERIWKEMNISDMALSYQDTLVKERKRTKILKKETVSLSTKIHEFADRLEIGKVQSMQSLIHDLKDRPEVVVTFLASLELSRLKKLTVFQKEVFDTIYLELIENLKGFNIGLATGFETDSFIQKIESEIQPRTQEI